MQRVGKPQIILALDVDTLGQAKHFVDLLYPRIKLFKIGSQLFTACGPAAIKMVGDKGGEVFLDLKFHDIPNTVAKAVAAAGRQKVQMLTLHISGGIEMIKAAVALAKDQAKLSKSARPLLIGVTVLTSAKAKSKDIFRLAKKGIDSGLDGVVCAAHEAANLRAKIKKNFLIVTPGIRPLGSSRDDQSRTATVAQAIKAGSNFLVIGRPILKAADPVLIAEEIIKLCNL